MTGPAPTVYVYMQLQDENGWGYWLRYVHVGRDHGEAANAAVDRAKGSHRIYDVETFDGEPQRFVVGARRYLPSKAEPA